VRVRLLPEAPPYARSSAERALSCDGRGRWFESSRAYHFADVAQREEHRSATPERPVRSGSSALVGLWCKRKHGELQPRRSGFDSWQACFSMFVAGRSGSVISLGMRGFRACGSTPALRPHSTTATFPFDKTCCGPERIRLSPPKRQVAGSSPARSASCSGSSVGRAVPDCTTTTAAAQRIEERRAGPASVESRRQRKETPSNDAHVTTAAQGVAGRTGAVIGESARTTSGRSRVRFSPGRLCRPVAQISPLCDVTTAATTIEKRAPVSYLLQYTRRPTRTRRRAHNARVDERLRLNRPDFDGGAEVRVFVEDTSAKRSRRRAPSPRLELRIGDCVNQITSSSRSSRPSCATTRRTRSRR
jgi:hypothetical protein